MIDFRKQFTHAGVTRCSPRELPMEFYRVTSKWSGVVDGQRVTVYAGAYSHNPAKGVLVLRALPLDGHRVAGKHCTVPQDRGALEIVESKGTRLRIAMAKGGSFWFEIPRGERGAA